MLKLKRGVTREKLVTTAVDDRPKVVVVDDEPGNVAAVEGLLSRDYRVYGFDDPRAALDHLLADDEVAVVVTDQRMPELLGTDVLLALKHNGRATPSVVVTGYTDVKDLVLCINEGLLHRYVLKPWSPDDLRAAVRSAIESERQRVALERLVPKQVLHRLFPDGLGNLSPRRSTDIDCVVMFADLRGFSRFAESVGTAASYRMLSAWFGATTPIGSRHGGFVDKVLGDGVLAIFDGPDRFDAALAATAELHAFARSFIFADGTHTHRPGQWRLGIGLSTGTVTLGTIGCPDRTEVTVIGDVVNRAARYEEVCKGLGCEVLLDAEIVGSARTTPPQWRPLGYVPLRGKDRLGLVGELNYRTQGVAPAHEVEEFVQAQSAGAASAWLDQLAALVSRYPEDAALRNLLTLWRSTT